MQGCMFLVCILTLTFSTFTRNDMINHMFDDLIIGNNCLIIRGYHLKICQCYTKIYIHLFLHFLSAVLSHEKDI